MQSRAWCILGLVKVLPNSPMINEDRLPQLKKKFLEYFRDVPIQKFGAGHIGVSEDTIIRWKQADEDFANCIEEAKAAFVKKSINDVKSKEWLLERIFKGDFAQRSPLLDEEGKPIPLLSGLNAVHSNDSTKETDEIK